MNKNLWLGLIVLALIFVVLIFASPQLFQGRLALNNQCELVNNSAGELVQLFDDFQILPSERPQYILQFQAVISEMEKTDCRKLKDESEDRLRQLKALVVVNAQDSEADAGLLVEIEGGLDYRITKCELATLLVREADLTAEVPEEPSFVDVDREIHWCWQYAEIVNANGVLTTNETGEFDTFEVLSQQEAAAAIERAFDVQLCEVDLNEEFAMANWTEELVQQVKNGEVVCN